MFPEEAGKLHEGEGEEDGRGEALGVAEDEDVAVPKASLQQP